MRLKTILCLCLLASSGIAHAGVLVLSSNGAYRVSSSLSTAATSAGVAGKTIAITTQQTLSGNVSLAGVKLRTEGAGCINLNGHTLALAAGVVDKITPEMFCGKGDGTTDDTTALQAAINTAAGVALVEIAAGKTYRFTSDISLPSGTVIQGTGTLLVDYDMATGHGALTAQGTVSGSTLLTADALATDVKVTTASNTMQAGDLLLIGSTKTVGAYPVLIKEVASTTSTDNVFGSAIGVQYLMSDGAYLKMITPVTGIVLRNFTIAQGPNSTTTANFILLSAAKQPLVDGVILTGQAGSVASGIITAQCYQPTIRNVVAKSGVTGGNYINVGTSQEPVIENNRGKNYDFGVGVYQCYRPTVSGNVLTGIMSTAVRGIKTYGCIAAIVRGNQIDSFETGLKIEGSTSGIYTDNQIRQIGRSASAHAINLSAAADGIASTHNSIANNTVENTTSNGVYLDSNATGNRIENNRFAGIGQSAILTQAPGTIISGNYIGSYAVSGITFSQLSVVTNNYFEYLTLGLPTLSTNGTFPPANACTISGNIAAGDSVDTAGSNPANFAACVISGNNVRGLQDRVFYASAMPTTGNWIIGDRVVNTTTPTGGVVRSWKRMTSNGNNQINIDWIGEGTY